MKCLKCHAPELKLASAHASWRCPKCKRSFPLEAVKEIERLRKLLARWVADADAGNMGSVDLQLMVDSEARE